MCFFFFKLAKNGSLETRLLCPRATNYRLLAFLEHTCMPLEVGPKTPQEVCPVTPQEVWPRTPQRFGSVAVILLRGP